MFSLPGVADNFTDDKVRCARPEQGVKPDLLISGCGALGSQGVNDYSKQKK